MTFQLHIMVSGVGVSCRISYSIGHCVFYGVESWSGVIEWSLGGKCWSGSVGLNSNKASPYFIT